MSLPGTPKVNYLTLLNFLIKFRYQSPHIENSNINFFAIDSQVKV
jgi:hypothetical protein